MKVVIDSEDLKRLQSREEKYLAYMEMLSYWWEDKTEVEALLWKIAELKRENKNLKEKVKELEEWLDRKEEVNKKLRSDLLMYQNQYWCLTD